MRDLPASRLRPRATKLPEQFAARDNGHFREAARQTAPIRARSVQILSRAMDCRESPFCSYGDGVQVDSTHVLGSTRLCYGLLISDTVAQKKSVYHFARK